MRKEKVNLRSEKEKPIYAKIELAQNRAEVAHGWTGSVPQCHKTTEYSAVEFRTYLPYNEL